MSARELVDALLRNSGRGSWDELAEKGWIDCQPDFETAHYLNGFHYADGKFPLRPRLAPGQGEQRRPDGPLPGPSRTARPLGRDRERRCRAPFRLVTAPARSFLNSTFNETPGSKAKEGRPEVLVRSADAEAAGIGDGDAVIIGNERGQVHLHARIFDGLRPGVLVTEGLWPNDAFAHGRGINTLTRADPVAPFGGAAFHDNRVWLRPDPQGTAPAVGAGVAEKVEA